MTTETSDDPTGGDPYWNPIRNIVLPDAKKQPDRSLAIVLASVVEADLEQAIIKRLVDNKKVADKLFKGLGPLNNFAAQIDLGFLLGLYRKDDANMLHAIRRIRNLFAHEMVPLDFESSEVKSLAQPLELVNEVSHKRRVGRELYIAACEFTMGGLMAIADDKVRHKTPLRGQRAWQDLTS